MTRRGCTHSNWHRTSRPDQRTGRCDQRAAAGPTVSGCSQDTRTRSPSGSLDHTGQPVTSLDEQHEQPGHLIVVGRDHSGSQHSHPTMPIDGT
jgi:hypothetical protein